MNSLLCQNPYSLHDPQGKLLPCKDKSKLMSAQDEAGAKNETTTDDHDANATIRNVDSGAKSVIVINRMALVQEMGKPPHVKTFQGLAQHFINRLARKTHGFHEIHLVFDRYDEAVQSLKSGTREKRQGKTRCISYRVSDATNISIKVPYKQVHTDTKDELTVYNPDIGPPTLPV